MSRAWEPELLGILERYGSGTMAKTALTAAKSKLRAAPLAPNAYLEKLVEETMLSFRMFCKDDRRDELWLELIDLIERHQG